MTSCKSRAWLTGLVVCGLLLGGVGAFQPPAARAADDEEADKTAVLETLGTLSAVFLFQTQATIGMLADAKSKSLYEEKVTNDLLQTTINFLELVEKQYERLAKSELADADKATVAQHSEVTDLLLQEANELKAFWKTNKKSHADRYLKLRQEAGEKLNEALGIANKDAEEEKK